MPHVTVERTYLRLVPPQHARASAVLPSDVRVDEVSPCPVALYRRLYAGVGGGYHWHDRLAWTDETLAAHLARDVVRVWVLRDARGDGGFFELVKNPEGAVEIAYFGLLPTHHGRGLGRAMLERAIDEALRWGATDVWLHTCTLDAPQALPNYLARGFVPFKRETYEATLPDA